MQKPGYNSGNYYLFGSDLTADDVAWAKQHNILAVGVVNAWRYRRSGTPAKDAEADAEKLKQAGLLHFQIDTEFEQIFLK